MNTYMHRYTYICSYIGANDNPASYRRLPAGYPQRDMRHLCDTCLQYGIT